MTFFRKNIPLVIIVIITIIPIIFWVFMSPFSYRFSDINSTTTSVGQIFGLLGITLFSINLILSSRPKLFDFLFSGINRMYNFHQKIGAIAFSLILFHPIFLLVKYLRISINSAANFLIPSSDIFITLGITSLIIFMVLILITFYIKIKYNVWRIFHKFMILAFIIGLAHAVLIPSDISRNIFLEIYIVAVASLGIILSAYHAFIAKYINNFYNYQIKNVSELNKKVVEIKLEPTDRVINFKPGQFVFVRFNGENMSSEPHPFSISSPFKKENFNLTIKSLGDFTNKIKNIKIGEQLKIEGPFGSFLDLDSKETSKKQIWIAGGIGVTPFLSKINYAENTNSYIDMYYCVKNKEEVIALEKFQSIQNNKFKLRLWFSEEKGRINGNKIEEISKNIKDSNIFICGPKEFMSGLKQQFINMGVRRKNIYYEEFGFL